VQYSKGERRLLAQELAYDKPNEQIVASGKLQLWDEGLFVSGERVSVNLATDEVRFETANFLLIDEHARGGAQKFALTDRNLVKIEDAFYTTCNPGQEDWIIKAKHIELDKVAEVGSAEDVTLEFFGTPVLYLPKMSFPLSNKRKSGFLTPSFRTGGETGFSVTVPYYFNIAPDFDATLSPRVMLKRGVMLGGEVRHLSHFGRSEMSAEYLPDDKVTDEKRGQFVFRHNGSFAPGWGADVDYNIVSDREYFEDFGNTLSVTSTRHLNQRADVTYAADRWSFLGRVQNYQTVDRTIAADDRPYKRLPQLLFNYDSRKGNYEFAYGFYAEGVNFDRRSSVDGLRLDAEPYVSYPMRTASAFLIPTAKLRYTHYSLNNTAAGVSNGQDRLVPSLSVDSGLLFERQAQLFGHSYVQTLEPRAFYLYKAFNDQTSLPIFDTSENTFSFAQLFRDDRFSGGDRVADVHQVSLAITSRVLDPRGAEIARASIGQIRHLRDRRVNLPGQVRQTDDSSDFVGELSARISRAWTINAGMQWNPHENRTDRTTVGVRYKPDAGTVVNASYRFIRDAVETSDISFRYPLRHDIGVVGRWNYALSDERTLEAVGGIEYNSCCWAVRAIARRFLSDTTGNYTNGVFLQLELKGLAGLGSNAEKFLQRSIPGYQNTF
ncbi:MAG: LPS assembly protein LptD, partial [Chromatiales bacterium]|nr:LPS assembly protein LptD [Chromatiales bacterium]